MKLNELKKRIGILTSETQRVKNQYKKIKNELKLMKEELLAMEYDMGRPQRRESSNIQLLDKINLFRR